MKASLQMLLLAAVAALAFVAHHKAPTLRGPVTPRPIIAQKAPAVPPRLYVPEDSSADEQIVGKLGLGRAQQPVLFVRPKPPVFTDIGTVADVAQRDQAIEGTGTVNTGLSKLPGVGTALQAQAAVEQVFTAILGGGNAAGLSPQQMAYACPGGKCQPNALALAENRLGTKTILINGDSVTIGGAALGGPGLTDAAAAVAEEQVSLRAPPSKLLG